MNPVALLISLRERGVHLDVVDGRLRYRAPKRVLTSEDLDGLQRSKNEIARLLEDVKVNGPVVRIPKVSRERASIWPLSFSQERLWFLHQMDPDSPMYTMSATVRIRGKVRLDTLRNALNQVIARHEVLRTRFLTHEGSPVQIVEPKLEVTIPLIDMRQLSPGESQSEAIRIVQAFAEAPFQLDRLPLLKISTLRISNNEYWCLFAMHHIISDAWSIGILTREVTAFYNAALYDRPLHMEELKCQYLDYACWEREVGREAFEKELSYWEKQLANMRTVELLNPRSRIGKKRTASGRYSFDLHPSLLKDIEKLAKRAGTTRYVILLAAFQLVLSYYSSQDDIVIGSPFANRHAQEVEDLIGCFINPVVFRTNCAREITFNEVLGQVRETALRAYSSQMVPFELIVNRIRQQRSIHRAPIFDVLFVFENTQHEPLDLAGSEVEILSIPRRESPYELMLTMSSDENTVKGVVICDALIFEDQAATMFLRNYLSVLETAVISPTMQVAKILRTSCRSVPEGVSLIRDPYFKAYPQGAGSVSLTGKTIEEMLDVQVSRGPSHTAIQSQHQTYTYFELSQAATRVAQAIFAHMGSADARIGLLFNHSCDMIVAIISAIKANKTYVPLDPAYPFERNHFVVKDSSITVILTNDANLSSALFLAGRSIFVINIDSLGSLKSEGLLHSRARPEDIACIIYSSGSTGQPKGTQQSHCSILHIVSNYTDAIQLKSADRCIVVSSYAHVMAMIDIFAALLNGASLHVVDVKEVGPKGLAAYLEERDISIYRSSVSLFRTVATNLSRGTELKKLRGVVLGAEATLAGDFALFKEVCSGNAVLVNTYGSTEATMSVIGVFGSDYVATGVVLPIGAPVGMNEVALLNQEGEPTPLFGQIVITNPYIFPSYLNRENENARCFRKDLLVQGRTTYCTGDFGWRQKDGSLLLSGRSDQQVNIRGFRVELGEIEAALLHSPLVESAVVLQIPDERQVMHLVAYVVPKSTQQIAAHTLREHCRRGLPEYMVPTVFRFMNELPRTPNGKINRKALRGHREVLFPPKRESHKPSSEVEQVVVEVWSTVLGRDEIPSDSDFFELGGHSLLGAQVISRIQDALHIQLPLRTLFEFPTVELFSREIENMRSKS